MRDLFDALVLWMNGRRSVELVEHLSNSDFGGRLEALVSFPAYKSFLETLEVNLRHR